MFGFTVWRHSILLFKVWSNHTLLHHLRTSTQTTTLKNNWTVRTLHCSKIKRSKSVRTVEKPLIAPPHRPCIALEYIIHSTPQITFKNRGERKKSIAYLPHLGSSFPLVFAVNWRQALICCHQNWCINPRAPSLWGQGQYGWTTLSWN